MGLLEAVSAGPVVYFELFLKNPKKWPKALIARLKNAYREFLSAADSGLKLHGSMVGDGTSRELQVAMDKGYKELFDMVSPYLLSPEEKRKTMELVAEDDSLGEDFDLIDASEFEDW